MKITNGILAVLFFVFAALQLNDLDPWVWIGIYGSVAVLCGITTVGYYAPKVILGAILFTIFGIGWYLPDFVNWLQTGMNSITTSMKAETPHVELVREFLGLVLVLATLIWLYWSGANNSNKGIPE